MKLIYDLYSRLNRELVWLLIFLMVMAPTIPAFALPKDGQIVSGSGTITESPEKMQINQNSDKLILNWQGFGIGNNESVKFIQPSSNSMALNRVLGSEASNIYGQLSANGKIFLINPNGILFGPGSKVDVGGLVASTMNISDADFLSNRFTFSENGGGSIINYGEITASPGGYIALLAPEVRNEGVLMAKMGTIALVSGEKVTLDMVGDGLINFAVDPSAVRASIINRHIIQADGGNVILSARSANDLIRTVVNNTGIIEAKSITNRDGIIRLEGETIQNSGTLDVSGKITGETGGEVQIIGENITILNNTLIDASGDRGGGTILIGGNEQGQGPEPNAETVSIEENVEIRADAITEGDGGKVIVWSDGETTFDGTIRARGGPLGGDGGFTEVSSKDQLIYRGWTDLRAPKGETGTLLLDPTNYTIGVDITGADLGDDLNTANITIQTADAGLDAGDVTVNDSVTWTSANTLTLRAHNDILVNNAITNAAGGDLVFRADLDANNTGTVTFAGLGHVTLTGGDASLYYNPSAYSSPTDYTGNFTLNGHTLTSYMLVNDVNHLQAMNTNLSGTYALGRDIDASVTSTWNAGEGFDPVGPNASPFTGIFDGDNHVISGLFINRPTTIFVGLLGVTDGGAIRNVGLEDVNLRGVGGMGGLVGRNHGSAITNAYSTGTVSGDNFVGGLVGINQGTITNAYSTGPVTGVNTVGGLVGINQGTITNAYSTGPVSRNDYVGGLVGINMGTITNAYSTGPVTGDKDVGGLVGWNVGIINSSYWDTQTSGLSTGVGDGDGSGVTGKTTTQMMTQATFAGWNFTNDWFMIEDNTRPFLRFEYSTTISNAHQLQLMSMNLGAKYTLSRDIDMSELTYTSGLWNTSTGFVPVGTSGSEFTGIFNGLGHTINNLFINRPATDSVGLFGVTKGGAIRNIGLENVNIIGANGTGGLVGENRTTITNAYSTGSVSGNYYIGGLVGENRTTITNAYSTGPVSGNAAIGGLVGWNEGTITNAYSTGPVSGNYYIGGLVGENWDTITNAYSTGPVTGIQFVGGLVGYNNGTTITNAYSTGPVSGNVAIGGLVGWNLGIINSSYWDTQTSGLLTSDGGTGMTTAEMMAQATFSGWDFTNIWFMIEGNTRPFLRSEYSTTISNAHQLQLMSMDLGADYRLSRDIDMSELTYASGLWNTSRGFVPVGNTTTTPFTGTFAGDNHVISGLYINRLTTDYVGLFGYTDGAAIRNIGLENVNIIGTDHTGGLVGCNGGAITNAYSTGTVSGNNDIGGLVGVNVGGTITNAYSTGVVSGNNDIGGLVGCNGGAITNAYSTGTVSGNTLVGGLVGTSVGVTINTSYWDKETSGILTGAFWTGTPKTTAEMMTQTTFSGWDFTNIWAIKEGVSYPYFMTQYGGSAPQIISGMLDVAGGGRTIQATLNGALLAQTVTGANGFYCFALTPGSVSSGDVILNYVSDNPIPGDLTKASSVYLSAGGDMTGFSLYSNSLLAGSYDGAISNTELATAKGSLIDTDIPYSVSGTDLTVDSNFGFLTVSGTTYDLNGDITTTNGFQTYDGPVTFSADRILTNTGTGGDMIFNGTVTGTGNFTLNTTGTVTVDGTNGITASGTVTVVTTGASDIILNSPITSGATADSIVLAAGQNFINNFGALALDPGLGRFLVYSTDPASNTLGGLTGLNLYNRTYGTNPPSTITQTGDRFVYSIHPTLTFTADDKIKVYGDPNLFTSTVSGYVGGDTASTAFSGAPSYTLSSENAGVWPITSDIGTLSSDPGYGFNFVDGTMTINKAPLTVTADDKTRVYGDSNPPFTATYSGYKLGENESVLWGSLSFFTPATISSSPGNYPITPSGLTSSNYELSFVDGTLMIQNTQSLPIPQPDAPPNRPNIVDNTSGGTGGGFSGFNIIGAGVLLPPGVE